MSEIIWNHAGLRDLLRSDEVLDECERVANKVLDIAQASAPVGGEDDEHPGQYRESLKVERMRSSQRAWARVMSDVPYAGKLQADTGHLPHALDAARGG